MSLNSSDASHQIRQARETRQNFSRISDLQKASSFYNINVTNLDIKYDVENDECEHSLAHFVEIAKKFQPGIPIDLIGIKNPDLSHRDTLRKGRRGIVNRIYDHSRAGEKPLALEKLLEFVEECKKKGILTEQNTNLVVATHEIPMALTLKNALPTFRPYSPSVDPKNREKFKEKATEIAAWMQEIKVAVENDQPFDLLGSVVFDQELSLKEAWDVATLICEIAPGAISHAKFNNHLNYIRMVCYGGIQLTFGLKENHHLSKGAVEISKQGGIGFDLDDLFLNWYNQTSRQYESDNINGIPMEWNQRAMQWLRRNCEGVLFESDYPGELQRKDDALNQRHVFLMGHSSAVKEREANSAGLNQLWQLPREIIDMVVEYVVPRKEVPQWVKDTATLRAPRAVSAIEGDVGDPVSTEENREVTSEPSKNSPKL